MARLRAEELAEQVESLRQQLEQRKQFVKAVVQERREWEERAQQLRYARHLRVTPSARACNYSAGGVLVTARSWTEWLRCTAQ